MAVTFTNLSRRFWSRKCHREPKISKGASVNSKTDSSMWESETLEFTLVKNTSSSSGSMKPKRHNSWEERKTDREYDVVLVPSDGECVSGSESEDFDWSIGWLEPHGSGFPSMDETDNNFAVLVPCYGRGYGGTVNDTNSQTLSNIRNFLDSYSAESIKSTDNCLFSWK
ncbi:hypothetical protein K1719_022656 [Acacia pycnantha]|nr:hypothetical protein K1719_022656 [Acacia pycnantha]